MQGSRFARARSIKGKEVAVKVVIPAGIKHRLVSLGQARNAAKDPSWTRRKSDVFNDAQVDALGCLGEWAISQYLDAPMDWNVHAHGDKGIDLKLADGRTVAVKLNHRWKGYLMVEERKGDKDSRLSDLSTDLICLIHGQCRVPGRCECKELMTNQQEWPLWIAGYLPTDEFLKKKQYADWGLGGRHYVRVNQLRGIEELKPKRWSPQAEATRAQSTADWIADYNRAKWGE